MCDEWGCYDYYCDYQPEVRRGHFVQGEEGTYVYSFSHAGVVVNDVAEMAEATTSVELPAPQGHDGIPWYQGVELGSGSESNTGVGGSSSVEGTCPVLGRIMRGRRRTIDNRVECRVRWRAIWRDQPISCFEAGW